MSPPDFDTDFCERHRQEVIDYVIQKYGEDSVSQIGTYGTLKAKAVVKDVAPPAIVAPTPAPLAPPTVEATPPAAKGTPYVVQEGQDLFDISVKWGVSATEIKALNNLTSDDVTPGQTLMIPAPRAE